MAAPYTPSCPRCGYELTGTIATWDRAGRCPLSGICSECGLTYAWRDILSDQYRHERRFFEHAQGRYLSSYLLTLRRALRPRRFWRWVRMEHPIVWRRACVIALSGPVLAHAAVVAVATALITALFFLTLLIAPSGSLTLTDCLNQYLGDAVWPLTDTEAWLGGWRYGWGAFEGTPVVHPWAAACLLLPLFAPWTFLLLPTTLRRARVRRAHLARIGAYGLVALPFVFAVPYMALLSVEISLGIVMALELIDSYWWWYIIAPIKEWRWIELASVTCLWQLLWWWRAGALYLRIPHAFAVAACMVVIALGLVVLALVLAGYGPALVWDFA